VSLSSTVDGGWKLYSLSQGSGGPVAMSVKAPDGAAYSIVGGVKGPAPDKAMDPNFGLETETYSGTSGFNLIVRLPKGIYASEPIELKVRSQACSDKLCLPARTVTVQVRRAA
jgi:thiol:disulfide interchange protein DsbD